MLLTRRQQAITERTALANAGPRRSADSLHRLFTQDAAAMEMRVFGAVDALDTRADDLWAQAGRAKLTGALQSAALAACGWAILALGYAAALLGVAILAKRGRATPGDVIMVSQLALQLALQRRPDHDLGPADPERPAPDRPLPVAPRRSAGAAQPLRGDREPACAAPPRHPPARRLRFTYPGAASPVLHHVDVDLPAGATIAIVGANGAGKSTLVKLLCRFYDPDEGRIEVDGVDLRDLDIGPRAPPARRQLPGPPSPRDDRRPLGRRRGALRHGRPRPRAGRVGPRRSRPASSST